MKTKRHYFDFETESRHSISAIKLIQKYISAADRIVDVGCGDGRVAEYATNYIGLEVNSGNYPKSKNENVVHFENGNDLQAWLDESIRRNDAIFCCDVLEHVDCIQKPVDTLISKLPNYICFVVPNEMNIRNRARFLFGKLPTAHGYSQVNSKPGFRHLWFSDPKMFEKHIISQFKDAGFKLKHDCWFIGIQKNKKISLKRWVWWLMALLLPASLMASERLFLLEHE